MSIASARQYYSLSVLCFAGKTIVTVLCDSGQRHLSRFHNREYLHNLGLTPTSTGTGLGFVS